jgi:hypothetical protein
MPHSSMQVRLALHCSSRLVDEAPERCGFLIRHVPEQLLHRLGLLVLKIAVMVSSAEAALRSRVM